MAGQHAAFWDNPEKGDSPVVRHAPDSNQYHYPDERQLERMRAGLGQAVTIPKAAKDGGSTAFDANEPGVVHVDPQAPDGGTIVDLAHLNHQNMIKAVATSSYPHEVFYKLGINPHALAAGQQQQAQPEQQARTNPLTPGGYVVPKAAQDGSQISVYAGYAPPPYQPAFHDAQVQEMAKMLPKMPQLPSASNGQVQPASIFQQPQVQPQVQPQMMAQPMYGDPGVGQQLANMANTMQQMMNGLGAINQRLASVEQNNNMAMLPALQTLPAAAPGRRRYPPALATRPVEEGPADTDGTFDDEDVKPIPRGKRRPVETAVEPEQPRQRVSDMRASEADEDPLIVGFETLKIAYVTGPVAVKPRRRVIYELPSSGQMQTRYHDVIVSPGSVVVVSDSRYDGDVYMPPVLDEAPIKLHVPHLKKTFVVTSLGLAFSNGVFDYILLPKETEEPLDYSDKE